MPYFMLVQGHAFHLKVEDPYAVCEEFEAQTKDLRSQAKAGGLLMEAGCDTDKDLLTLFVGHELLPGRHIYQGQTHAARLADLTELAAVLTPFANQLRDCAQALAIAHETTVEEVEGVVLNQFD